MRESRYGIGEFFRERFSPTLFLDRSIGEEDFLAILEAGSTAPSCYNEQPWRFVLGSKKHFLKVLAPANGEWAKRADRFILLCSESEFKRNGKMNRYAAFDSGTAWGYMTMEAHRRGIAMHAMAGFDTKKAVELFNVGDLNPLAVIALGYSEQPHTMTPRMALEDIIIDRR
jgi:nitroreductase